MEIAKFSSQFIVALGQATLHFRQALYPLMERARIAAQGVREAMASSFDAVVVANSKLSKHISQFSANLSEATLHLRDALNPLTERGKGALQKLPELLANFLNAVVVVGGKIHQHSSQIIAALKQTPAHVRQALVPLAAGGRNVLAKTRSLQDARHARENHLRELLDSSADAVVVTNIDRRFVSANPNALHLFGVSDANIRQFTIDAFLLEDEILHLDENGVPLISREETRGECKIRRLTGNLRVADYVFVPNFVPFRHLFIFRNDREWLRRKRVAAG